MFISPDIKVLAYSINKEDFFSLVCCRRGKYTFFSSSFFTGDRYLFCCCVVYLWTWIVSVLAPRLVWGKDLIVKEWLLGSRIWIVCFSKILSSEEKSWPPFLLQELLIRAEMVPDLICSSYFEQMNINPSILLLIWYFLIGGDIWLC